MLSRSKLKIHQSKLVFLLMILSPPGCMSQVGQGGQISIQINIEDFREDEVVAHNVHWITDYCRVVQVEKLPTLFGQIFKVRDATVFKQDSSVKFG